MLRRNAVLAAAVAALGFGVCSSARADQVTSDEVRPVKADTCLYSVPTDARSTSESTGRLTAPGAWSSANSAGLRTSMMASNDARDAASAAVMTSMSDMDGRRWYILARG